MARSFYGKENINEVGRNGGMLGDGVPIMYHHGKPMPSHSVVPSNPGGYSEKCEYYPIHTPPHYVQQDNGIAAIESKLQRLHLWREVDQYPVGQYQVDQPRRIYRNPHVLNHFRQQAPLETAPQSHRQQGFAGIRYSSQMMKRDQYSRMGYAPRQMNYRHVRNERNYYHNHAGPYPMQHRPHPGLSHELTAESSHGANVRDPEKFIKTERSTIKLIDYQNEYLSMNYNEVNITQLDDIEDILCDSPQCSIDSQHKEILVTKRRSIFHKRAFQNYNYNAAPELLVLYHKQQTHEYKLPKLFRPLKLATLQTRVSHEKDKIYFIKNYQESIASHLEKTQRNYMPGLGLKANLQRIDGVNLSMVMDWLIDLSVLNNFETEIIHKCSNYLNRFIAKCAPKVDDLQLIGLTCLWVATKFETRRGPLVAQMAKTMAGCTPEKMRQMEAQIIRALSYDMGCVSSYAFVNTWIPMLKINISIQFLSWFLIELTLMDSQIFGEFIPSEIAAASIVLALYYYREPLWSPELQYIAKLKLRDLKKCILYLNAVHGYAVSRKTRNAVVCKYMREAYRDVAHIQPALMTWEHFDFIATKYDFADAQTIDGPSAAPT